MKFHSSAYAASLLAAALHSGVASAAYDTSKSPLLLLSNDSTMNFDLLTPLGESITGGGDVGPILAAAKDVKAGNMTSFTEVFYKLANDTKAQAEDPDNAYDPVNVRDTWFSAAGYFRKADNYLHGNWSNPLIESLWDEQLDAFNKGIAALPIPGKRIRIPATKGNFTVEAIWYSASESKHKKLPTLIIGNGFDAAQEDSYHNFVAPSLARGWNCITYEGPGQPTVRRNQGLGFIPDWEKVVTPVVDYVLSEKKDVVDSTRLILLGNSMGGYLAARAAAFEPRLSAAVLIDGVWDNYAAYARELSPELLAIYEAGNYTQFDDVLLSAREAGKLPTGAAWGIDQGLWAFRTHSPSDFFTQIKSYNVESFIHKIRIPVFVGDAELESSYIGQPKQVADALGHRATLHTFKGAAGFHCQTGAGQELSRTIHAWLNKTFNNTGDGH
ncbi:Alpha/Beta hydrolase protein [Penicillium bovifimosum]|uniref:Alpha/Beta hydrolase protein n=1 Tax=Penicillium bovifimosum TaxID=126998 RepID=A0A9W9GHH1_9EURO|nr:Alpha/Beta hydrolase protein [Penicillium bovifimosum]KAJ5120512.1 Alpha/Beta hydrolase protein [Penicillium bovifimosum]